MKIPTQLIFDDDEEPAFAVIPYPLFQKYFLSGNDSDQIPMEVRILTRKYGFSSVKAWRIHRGFTVQEIAKKLDITVKYYRKIENGESHYPIYDRQLAELFQIPLEQIKGENEFMNFSWGL